MTLSWKVLTPSKKTSHQHNSTIPLLSSQLFSELSSSLMMKPSYSNHSSLVTRIYFVHDSHDDHHHDDDAQVLCIISSFIPSFHTVYCAVIDSFASANVGTYLSIMQIRDCDSLLHLQRTSSSLHCSRQRFADQKWSMEVWLICLD